MVGLGISLGKKEKMREFGRDTEGGRYILVSEGEGMRERVGFKGIGENNFGF